MIASADSHAKPNSFEVRILRQAAPGEPSFWERHRVTYEPNLNVISVLQKIAAQAVTSDGDKTTPVAWDCNCLEEVCGACTMLVNGKTRQSCSTLVDKLLEENPEAVRGLVNAIAKAMADVLVNPQEGIDIITATEPLSNGELEMKRLQFALDNLIFSDESKVNGIGAIDVERLTRSITTIKELYDLPETPEAEDVFDASFLPPMDMRSF